MGTFLNPGDFSGISDVEELIEDAEAQAWLAAHCLFDEAKPLDARQKAAAKSILRGIVLRWNEAGTGANAQVNAGPFAITAPSQGRRGALWPSEITDLQKVCKNADADKAYGFDTAPGGGLGHALLCSVTFGANYCTCGADLTAGEGPLTEQGVP